MKNRIQLLLAATLAFNAAPVFANCESEKSCDSGCPTNKTHLTPRSHGVNLALEKTAGWPNLMNHSDEDAFGAHLQAAFFMMGSTEEDAIARYFLFKSATPATSSVSTTNPCDKPCGDECASVTFRRQATATGTGQGDNNYITTAGVEATGAGSTADFDLGFLVHNFNTGAAGSGTGGTTGTGADVNTIGAKADSTTKLQLCPEHEAIGVTFNYHQDLNCLLKGLYLEVAVPVVNVENSLGMSTSGDEAAELKKFFQGTRTELAVGDRNAFKNLTRAKMDVCERSETGVADVDVILGYKFLDKAKYHVALNLGVTIPTGNTPDGEYVFDAVVGNGGHVGFGAGLDARACVWESDCSNHCLKVNLAMNYRYLFENDEVRTLGLTKQNFGQYMLLINRTQEPNAQQLVPAANVTTLRVDVTPGSQFDGILSLNYNWCGFALDLGYNLFFRECEKVELACSSACGTTTPQFPEGTWAIATRNARMNDAIGSITAANPMTKLAEPNFIYRELGRADLDCHSAETKSLTTHKLFAGLGYWTKSWEVPVLVGVGGHYEWADCDLISNWGFNARLGVSF